MGAKVLLHWMENRANPNIVTWGTPWAKGEAFQDDIFTLNTNKGKEVPVTSGVNAYWPDGSVKWTIHTADLKKEIGNFSEKYILEAVKNKIGIKNGMKRGIKIQEDDSNIAVDAGTAKAIFPKSGTKIIENGVIGSRTGITSGESICIIENQSKESGEFIRREVIYRSSIINVTVEDLNHLKCVIRVEGIHRNETLGKEIIPFVLRFFFSYGDTSIKLTHTFLYDGHEDEDFIKGLGLEFKSPTDGEFYNRHIKILGDYGAFHEASQLLLSWRPKIDENIYVKQCKGERLSFNREKHPHVYQAIDDITIWDNYRLYQNAPNHFSIKKRTNKSNCTYIDAVHGEKAKGIIYAGGESGGIAVGMKDFWQKYPSSLWAEDLTKDEMKVTAWIWSYENEPMDFRHYDTVGHASAYYEGFNEVGASAYGIGNTNELIIFGFEGNIPSDIELQECVNQIQKPPMLLASPEYYHSVKVLGEWSLIKRDTPVKIWLEEQMDLIFEFYKQEIKQRNWYGLFHYGDFMHTYDKNRHCWRYDMGGYAWQNTELVPTLWLWYGFLRSGREDFFTMAEAMSRHCSEVDTYHMGKLKGIGSRHNVIHWGCSCKEPRIAMAGHHRLYYYLTGDYRMGDILDEVKDGDYATLYIDPLRFFYDKDQMVYKTHARTGPDWSSYCSNWLTAWERGNISYKEKIKTGIEDLKKAPLRLISGADFEYNPDSGNLRYIGENAAGGSHLTVCMGGPQTWFELADLLEDESWKEMLAEYGDFYFASQEEKMIRSNGLIENRDWPLAYMASAMGMYGARYYHNDELGKKVWRNLINELMKESGGEGLKASYVEACSNKDKLKEIPWISTNFVAQWCLNVIVSLELGKEFMPETID